VAEQFGSIAISPSGSTLLNAMAVSTTAGNPVYNEVVCIGDNQSANVCTVLAEGAVLVEPGGTNTQPVSGSVTANAPFQGATGANVPGTAAFNGLVGHTAYPTAVTDGQMVGAMGDKAGRITAVLNSVRDLTNPLFVNATATTAQALIAAGATGVFNDIVSLVITSAMTTSATLTISDNGSSGNSYVFNIAPLGGLVSNYTSPLKQQTSAAAWDYSLSAAGTLAVNLIYVANK